MLIVPGAAAKERVTTCTCVIKAFKMIPKVGYQLLFDHLGIKPG